MANDKKLRPIRFDQFKKQLEELGIADLQEVQMGPDAKIFMRLGSGIDRDDDDEFIDRLRAADTSKDAAMVVLDYYPEATAEEQWQIFEEAGGTADQLATLYGSATVDQQERLGKLRPRRS